MKKVVISSRKLIPNFHLTIKSIVFKGRYDSIYAVHFIDTSGNYLGYILKDYGYLNSPTWAPDNNRLAVSIDRKYIYSK